MRRNFTRLRRGKPHRGKSIAGEKADQMWLQNGGNMMEPKQRIVYLRKIIRGY